MDIGHKHCSPVHDAPSSESFQAYVTGGWVASGAGGLTSSHCTELSLLTAVTVTKGAEMDLHTSPEQPEPFWRKAAAATIRTRTQTNKQTNNKLRGP
jgi:hypothetical protein